ncbi:N-6 DNA methylase [Micromonospora sp. NPDC005087]|uniref:N-6 DNA methylase n=1 Tax=Micromonospora sp. NPDC005087 TaxID=3364225 RepID=UPI00367A62EB
MTKPRPDQSLTRAAEEALRTAGYPLVTTDAGRFDVVGYAVDESGRLKADAVVEAKRPFDVGLADDALEILAQARSELATRRHYVFTGTSWFAADSGLRRLTPTDGPEPVEHHAVGRLNDRDVAERLLSSAFWAWADRERGQRQLRAKESLDDFLLSLSEEGRLTLGRDNVSVDPDVLWAVLQHLTVRVLGQQAGGSELLTAQSVASAMARIAGSEGSAYLDPFCGSGSLLWHVADLLRDVGRQAHLLGRDINPGVLTTARAMARLSPVPMAVEQSDSFAAALPMCDRVLSQPPVGLRLQKPFELSNGATTTDGELSSIDVCLRALQPRGRAVLQLTRGWTFRSGASLRYRQHLATRAHVAALIGLPSGSLLGTKVPSTLVVLAAEEPGDTFVAQLEQDWREQLAPDGAVFRALLAHLGDQYHDAEPA